MPTFLPLQIVAETSSPGHSLAASSGRDVRAVAPAQAERIEIALPDGTCIRVGVTKPDRLARSTINLLATVRDLEARDVGMVVLSMGGGERLDTRNPTSKLMLTILAGGAEWERQIMLERQLEGIAKAKSEGKHKGRVPTARKQAAEALRLRSEGLHPLVIADRLGISKASVYRLLRG